MGRRKYSGRGKKKSNIKLKAVSLCEQKQILLATSESTKAEESISENTLEVEKSFCSKLSVPQRRSSRTRVILHNCFNCKICHLRFATEFSLRKHLDYYSDPIFTCKQCKTAFTYKKQLEKHIVNAHGNPSSKFTSKCVVCNQMFAQARQLQAHLAHYHEKYRVSTKTIDEVKLAIAKENPELVKDGVSSTEYSNKITATQHSKTESKFETEISEKNNTLPVESVEVFGKSVEDENKKCDETSGTEEQIRTFQFPEESPENNVLPEANSNENKTNASPVDLHCKVDKSHDYDKETAMRKFHSCKDCYVPLMRVKIPETSSATADVTQLQTKKFHIVIPSVVCGQKVKKILTKRAHTRTTEITKHVCTVCCLAFRTQRKLVEHENVYSRSATYRCAFCETMFYGVPQWRCHMATAHNPIIKRGYDFECAICNQRFNSRRLERMHRMHIHREASILSFNNVREPTTGNLSPPESDDPGDEEMTTDKCNVCNIVFSNKKRFIDHIIYYMTSETIHCKICGEKFKGQYEAHYHNKIVHYSEDMRKAYTHNCDICDEGFMFMTHFQAHMSHVHMREVRDSNANDDDVDTVFSNLCTVCDLKFSTPALLAAHESDFVNDGEYLCNRCSKKCRTPSLLLDHLTLNHSNIAIDDGVQCRRCNENFLTPSAWVCHAKHIHRPNEPSEFYLEKNVASTEKSGDIRCELIPTNESISSSVAYFKVKNSITFGTIPPTACTNDRAHKRTSVRDAEKIKDTHLAHLHPNRPPESLTWVNPTEPIFNPSPQLPSSVQKSPVRTSRQSDQMEKVIIKDEPSGLKNFEAAQLHTEIFEDEITITYECPDCQEKCTTLNRLNEHITAVHEIDQAKNQVITLTCNVCDVVFANKNILDTHREKIHNIKAWRVVKSPVPVLEITVPNKRANNSDNDKPIVIGRLYKLEEMNAAPKPVKSDEKNRFSVTRIVDGNVEKQKPVSKSTVKIAANAAVRLKPPKTTTSVPFAPSATSAENFNSLLTTGRLFKSPVTNAGNSKRSSLTLVRLIQPAENVQPSKMPISKSVPQKLLVKKVVPAKKVVKSNRSVEKLTQSALPVEKVGQSMSVSDRQLILRTLNLGQVKLLKLEQQNIPNLEPEKTPNPKEDVMPLIITSVYSENPNVSESSMPSDPKQVTSSPSALIKPIKSNAIDHSSTIVNVESADKSSTEFRSENSSMQQLLELVRSLPIQPDIENDTEDQISFSLDFESVMRPVSNDDFVHMINGSPNNGALEGSVNAINPLSGSVNLKRKVNCKRMGTKPIIKPATKRPKGIFDPVTY